MNDYEEFELKYVEEIYQLYLNLKEISEFNNLKLFQSKKDNFMDLFDLLFKSIEFVDDEEIQDDTDKFNDQEIILCYNKC